MSLSPSESILKSTKKLLGIDAGYDAFDPDIIININSAFFHLAEIGVGPKLPFVIHSDEETWSDFIAEETAQGLVKVYVFFKVKLIFDPPSSSFVLDSYNKQIQELEWRMNSYSDSLFKDSWVGDDDE